MRSERHGLWFLRAKGLDDFCPKHAGRPHLGHFHKVVLANRPEEGQTLGKGIHRQAGIDTRADVFQAIGQRITQFDIGRCSGLLHMVAGNGNAVELGHVFRRVLEDIADDAHGHFRRIDIGVAHHKFLQDIVLNRAGQDFLIHALFDTGLDEEGENRQYGAVHGHGYGHLVKGNPREQDVHIEHGADRHTGLTYVTDYAGIIRIIAAMRRQVKGDGKPLLPGSQIAAVERIGFLRRGEPRILAYRPRTEHIHGRIWPTQAWRNTAGKVQMVHMVIFIMVVEWLYGNMFHGTAGKVIKLSPGLRRKEFFPLFGICSRRFPQAHLGKVRILVAHYAIIPFFCCRSCRIL